MSNENIIMFPKNKKNTPPQTIEELRRNINDVRREHIENVIGSFIPEMFSILVDHTGDPNILTEDDLMKDSALVVESVKSLLYKYIGVEYPLQNISDKLFTLKENNDIGETPVVYQRYNSIELTVKKDK